MPQAVAVANKSRNKDSKRLDGSIVRPGMNPWDKNIFTNSIHLERGIHQSLVHFPHKGQWRGALMFHLICPWIKGWVNNRKAGDLKHHHTHYDVIVMWHLASISRTKTMCHRVANFLLKRLIWLMATRYISFHSWRLNSFEECITATCKSSSCFACSVQCWVGSYDRKSPIQEPTHQVYLTTYQWLINAMYKCSSDKSGFIQTNNKQVAYRHALLTWRAVPGFVIVGNGVIISLFKQQHYLAHRSHSCFMGKRKRDVEKVLTLSYSS